MVLPIEQHTQSRAEERGTYLSEELRGLAAGPAGVGELLGLEHGDVQRPMQQDLRHWLPLPPPPR
jgi:hypothetical protein